MLRIIPRWHLLILIILAGQYAVFHLATGTQDLDGPRNLHWGIYVFEQPRFLIDTEDVYNRVNGFPPDPSSLAPRGMAADASSPMHPWWGPGYLLLFAAVWALTGSYTVLQLVVPLAAGAAVILTYLFGVRFFHPRVALLASILFAWFPNYRETAMVGLVEPISALLIIAAAWAFLERRTWLTTLLGILAVYGKIDLILLYFGTLTLTTLFSIRSSDRIPLRHALICLFVPALALAPWLLQIYVIQGRPTMVSGGANPDVFRFTLPLMLDQVFTIGWPVSLPGILLLPAVAGMAVARRLSAPAPVYRALGSWMALGMLVLLVYVATPGASNNPRVFIPALPALCLLVADGLLLLAARIRLIALSYLLLLYLFANLSSAAAQIVQGQFVRSAMPVWETLRQAPRGVVLTDQYWFAALFARQPVTWFEHDEAFQRNIMQNKDNFVQYLATAPIRYIVLPRDEQRFRELFADHPIEQFRRRLPFGRDSGWRTEPLAAPEIRTYLEQHVPFQVIGDYVLFTVPIQANRAPADSLSTPTRQSGR